jgi:hypothetical protein
LGVLTSVPSSLEPSWRCLASSFSHDAPPENRLADLSEVLGAILKDIAHARVISDIFSRDASLEYEQDSILRDFTVPRIDLREATISLKFAVRSVQRRTIDPDELIRTQGSRIGMELGRELYANFIERSPHREELTRIDREQNLQLEPKLRQLVDSIVLSDPDGVRAVLNRDAQPLITRVQLELNRLLVANRQVREVLVRGSSTQSVRNQLSAAASDLVARLIQRVAEAIEAANRQALTADVAVTPEELSQVPQALVSELRIVTEIRNYEVVEVETTEGRFERHLRLE